MPQLRHFLRRRAFAEHRLRRIARHEVNQREHERRDAEQHRNRQQQTANEVRAACDSGASTSPQILPASRHVRIRSIPSRRSIFASPCARRRARARRARAAAGAGQRGADEPALELLPRRLERDAARSRPPRATCAGSVPGVIRPRRGPCTASEAMTFCSSRTLPGQSYRASAATVSGASVARDPTRAAASSQKCAASAGMSVARSRSGGTAIRTTSSRKRRSARKRPAATSCSRRSIGRRDDARVDAARQVLADAPDLAVLQHAQQLGLRARRTAPRLRRGTACRRRLPRTAPARSPIGAGERAAGVAEELRFEQLVGDAPRS